MYETYYKTPVGFAYITADDHYITKVSIRGEEYPDEPPASPLLQEAVKQLHEYFEGERKSFDLPLQQPGTNFQQQVWKQLQQIAYGNTITYGQQSQLMKARWLSVPLQRLTVRIIFG
jgi:methylated-DNA-[protein]-cysteine S-methyltransferase